MDKKQIFIDFRIHRIALEATENKLISAACAYTLIGMSKSVDSRYFPLQTSIDVNTISEITNQTSKTVRSHISKLSELGIIKIEFRKGKSNRYIFNIDNNCQDVISSQTNNNCSPSENNSPTIPCNFSEVSPNITSYNNKNNNYSISMDNPGVSYNSNQLDFISATEKGV